MSLRWGPAWNRQAGLWGRGECRHVLRHRPPAGCRADLPGRVGDHGCVVLGEGGRPSDRRCPHSPPCPAGLWLGMLVCVMLATAAFVTYTARMDWKRAAEEVSALRITRETMPDTILSAPHPHPVQTQAEGSR